MTEKNNESGPPVGIDPAGWDEPKEEFPGEVTVSVFRLCDEKYMAPTEFRAALPRAIWQWDLRVKRLDAVYQLFDGSRADVIRYGGYDLERLNNNKAADLARQGLPLTEAIEPVNLRSNKEAMISNAWKGAFPTQLGAVIPTDPESARVLEGCKAQFEFYPSKRVGRNVAKNVLLPITALPPDYSFTGNQQVFIVPRRNEDSDGTTASVSVPSAVVSAEVAIEQLPTFLNGQNRSNVPAIMNALPPSLRNGDVVNGLVSGTLFDKLATDGKITIDASGNIVTAGVIA